jgi:hypothetical protein
MSPEKNNFAEKNQHGTGPAADPGIERDREERPTHDEHEIREKALDKTLADSFPTSDPPSTIPDPGEDDSQAA